ncbi:hypothetical protein MICAF_1580012 [Microcystis aeruginosa PCC 9807]|uniref:Uncharacterized protein n=1 Tax=Microcystis aeruginosa PCC 9807 TaxID=1160283 RepID=I4H175_MICAE|nr:hypothetical protein MICAF_1580012 [Microcystis aeruginosa PCC 9807]
MSGIKLEDIREITKNPQGKGYLIIFNDKYLSKINYTFR